MKKIFRCITLFVIALTSKPWASAEPADAAELSALREQVRALERQLNVLGRQIELREEAAAAAAPATPKVTVSDKGFSLSSADGASSIKLRGLVQLDSRMFFNDAGGMVNNSFVLRRARIITEGTFARNYSFQLVPEFGGGSVSLLDANVGLTVGPALQFKVGKFKSPVGLELLQSDSWTFFNERSLVTNLVPNRDLGIQASGEVLHGTVGYTAGLFGGVSDGGSSSNSDFDNEKDAVARVMLTPFKNRPSSAAQGLSMGISGSIGREKTAAGRTSGYRTDGQQTFFSYNATTVADGLNWRISPQMDFRNGPLGLIGEYVISTVNVRPSAIGAKAELQSTAWQLAAGYVLTGEASSYAGVVPRTNFDFAAGTWGAFELTVRYANLRVDNDAFPAFASASTNAREASSFGLGLNWYLSKAVAVKLAYYHTDFSFSSFAAPVSAAPVLLHPERAFISRFQVSF